MTHPQRRQNQKTPPAGPTMAIDIDDDIRNADWLRTVGAARRASRERGDPEGTALSVRDVVAERFEPNENDPTRGVHGMRHVACVEPHQDVVRWMTYNEGLASDEMLGRVCCGCEGWLDKPPLTRQDR